MKSQDLGYSLNHSDFQSIFGTQKYMKINDLAAILKRYELESFDLKNEIIKTCFENRKFKFDKF